MKLTIKWSVSRVSSWSEYDCRKFTGAILRIKDYLIVEDSKWLMGIDREGGF